jgi:hypothetical protein
MSKITEAINRAQKEFTKALDEVTESQRKVENSLFIKEPLTDLRTGFKNRDPLGEKLSKSKPFIALAVLLLCLSVFVFGVRQGKKINQLQEQEILSENDASVQEESTKSISYAVDDSGKAIVFSNGQWIDYRSQEKTAEGLVEQKEIEDIKKEAAPEVNLPYTIQLVTYSDSNRSEEEVVRLKNLGFNSFSIPSDGHFQVAINRFEDVSAGAEFLRKLDSKFLRKYPGAYVRLIKRR